MCLLSRYSANLKLGFFSSLVLILWPALVQATWHLGHPPGSGGFLLRTTKWWSAESDDQCCTKMYIHLCPSKSSIYVHLYSLYFHQIPCAPLFSTLGASGFIRPPTSHQQIFSTSILPAATCCSLRIEIDPFQPFVCRGLEA